MFIITSELNATGDRKYQDDRADVLRIDGINFQSGHAHYVAEPTFYEGHMQQGTLHGR